MVMHNLEIMYVSDRAGGVILAFNDIYEKPLHFYCLYHLMKNLKGMYKGRIYSDVRKNHLCKLLKDAAHAPNIRLFNEAIERFIQKGGRNARHFLKDLPRDKWALAFAPDVNRYRELTSTAAESFNSWILEARCLSVTFMFDSIRMQLMRWFNERREESDKWTGALTKTMEDQWNGDAFISGAWGTNKTSQHGIFEVLSPKTCVVSSFTLTNYINSHMDHDFMLQLDAFIMCAFWSTLKNLIMPVNYKFTQF